MVIYVCWFGRLVTWLGFMVGIYICYKTSLWVIYYCKRNTTDLQIWGSTTLYGIIQLGWSQIFLSCIRIWQNKTYVDENYHIVSITFFEWSPPTDILPDIYSGSLSGILSEILSDMFSRILSGILFDIFIWHIFWHFIRDSIWHSMWRLALAIEVPHFPLRSGFRSWCLSAVEVRQCPLSSGAGDWGRGPRGEVEDEVGSMQLWYNLETRTW